MGMGVLWLRQIWLSSAVMLVLDTAVFSQTTFTRDILPILQKRCQQCHRPGEIGPMSLMTYSDVRPWASAIRESVRLRKMPPWFADPRWGKFANDPRLSDGEVAAIESWA